MINNTMRLSIKTISGNETITPTELEVTFAEDNKIQLELPYGSLILTEKQLVAIQNMLYFVRGEFDDNKTAES